MGNRAAMKQAKTYYLPAYCPWTDGYARGGGIARSAWKQIKFDESAPGGLHCQATLHCRATWSISHSDWQANSMDQPVDEHTASDLVAIADARQLSATQCKVLARNVTGALRPNRDFFLWVLVNLLSAVFQCRSRRQRAFDPVAGALEIVLAREAE